MFRFTNTLRKCHSTVRALIYSQEPRSRRWSAQRETGYLLLLGREVIECFVFSLADCSPFASSS